MNFFTLTTPVSGREKDMVSSIAFEESCTNDVSDTISGCWEKTSMENISSMMIHTNRTFKIESNNMGKFPFSLTTMPWFKGNDFFFAGLSLDSASYEAAISKK